MSENECAFVANSLTITRVMELFDNLADYKFVTKAPVNAKGLEVYVFKPNCPERYAKIMYVFGAEYII